MKLLGYSLVALVILAPPVLYFGSAMMLEWHWFRWVALGFAVALPLAIWGDLRRERRPR